MSYEIKTDAAGKCRFNLKSTNGQVILSSQGYVDKAGALNGIASVRTHGQHDENFERKDASDDSSYFVLKAKNSQVIGNSQMYSSAAARDKGIESVKKNCISTDIKEI